MKRVALFLFAFLLFAFGAVSGGSAQSVNVLDENLKYNTVSANLARIEEQLKKKILVLTPTSGCERITQRCTYHERSY